MSDEDLERFAPLSTADVADAMDRLGVVDSCIGPVGAGYHMVGRAVTVWTRGGDNLFVHRALELLAAGDVLVVNGQGDHSRALLGDRMVAHAQARGANGIVVDGGIRDVAALRRLGMPVFARCVTPAGPYKNGPGHLNVPVAVGGVVVIPGDVLVGDDDGVAVVPAGRVADVLERALAIAAGEGLPELPAQPAGTGADR